METLKFNAASVISTSVLRERTRHNEGREGVEFRTKITHLFLSLSKEKFNWNCSGPQH
jgi:hypothetical protein